jgi:hypothetical protein
VTAVAEVVGKWESRSDFQGGVAAVFSTAFWVARSQAPGIVLVGRILGDDEWPVLGDPRGLPLVCFTLLPDSDRVTATLGVYQLGKTSNTTSHPSVE